MLLPPIIRTNTPPTLPLIPVELLKRFHVHERDSRLAAAARLLQALWLRRRGIPMGMHNSRDGRTRRLGSRLSPAAALAGRNFLTPALATIAHRMIAYQEPGAFIDRERTLGNALSSTGVCLNFIGTLLPDLSLGARVLRILFPDQDIDQIIDVRFEHSPLRGPAAFDRSAFDCCIWFSRRRPSRGQEPRHTYGIGVLAWEFKYTEELNESAPVPPDHLLNLAEAAAIYKEPGNALLRVAPLQQLFREHLLAQAAVMQGLWPAAVLVSVAPAANERVQRQADLYRAFLNPTLEGQVPFVHLTLERFIEALEKAAAPEQAAMLFERYLDWGHIDVLVAEALKKRVAKWPRTTKATPPLKLTSQAA